MNPLTNIYLQKNSFALQFVIWSTARILDNNACFPAFESYCISEI